MNPETLPGFTLPATPTNVFMIDIETAGTSYGAAIIEIGAAEFNPLTGEILREWSTPIDLLDSSRLGLKVEAETAGFHLSKNYPDGLRGAPLWRAMNELDVFLHLGSAAPIVWAWGIDFERMHITASCAALGFNTTLWHHWNGRCARTAWKLAFPDTSPPGRPHRAADDVRAQITDLCKALKQLSLTTAYLVQGR